MKREICTIPIFDILTAMNILPIVAALSDEEYGTADKELMDAIVYVIDMAFNLLKWETSDFHDREELMKSIDQIEAMCKEFRNHNLSKQQS